mgnify:CR=1 FL=1
MNGFSDPGRVKNRMSWGGNAISLAAPLRGMSSDQGADREGRAVAETTTNWARVTVRGLIYAALFIIAILVLVVLGVQRLFRQRLAHLGLDASALQCPTGLPGISGKEPALIAVAVVAELLQLAQAGSAKR